MTFTERPLISQSWLARNVLLFLTFPILGFILGVSQVRAWQFVLFNLLNFFVLALLCHGQLFLRRPKPQFLTLFYFCLALGGVVAGLFNGIIAPHCFNQVYEYPMAILFSILVIPLSKRANDWWLAPLILLLLGLSYLAPSINWPYGGTNLQMSAILSWLIIVVWQKSGINLFCALLVLLVFIFSPYLQKNNLLLQQRDFYGVKQVIDKKHTHVLISQSTVHGLQDMNEKKPISGYRSYYGATEQVMKVMQQQMSSLSVTLIGLGTGTMLCQFRSNDFVQVMEIDEQMIELAKNPLLFTYLRDCPPKFKLIKNDGRLAIANTQDHSQDLIILDAFNSDAVPIHLMTLEAFTLYQHKLTAKGVILVNLSNRYIDLLPVINAVGRSLDLMVLYISFPGDTRLGQFDSKWALLTANEPLAFAIMNGAGWRFLASDKQFLWTDDYSNIVPLLSF